MTKPRKRAAAQATSKRRHPAGHLRADLPFRPLLLYVVAVAANSSSDAEGGFWLPVISESLCEGR